MGRALLIWRLVLGDIKRRPVQAVLLLVMIVTTTTTLTIGLALRRVTDSPFARTRAATHGPDVTAAVVPPNGTAAQARRQLASLTRGPGVSATSGLYPLVFPRLTAPGIDVQAEAQGRDPAQAAIDQPALSAGSWVRPGGAVLERGFASALGLRTGQTIRLNGRAFRVVGIATSTAQCFYPVSTPGVIWLTRTDTQRLAAGRRLGYLLDIKLADPASAEAFAYGSRGDAFFGATNDDPIATLQTWDGIEHDDFRVVTVDQKALLIMGSLLAMLALASIAVVVGGRMAEQTRRVGLLKAVGATPLLVAVVLLAENLLLALAAAAAGIAAGELLAPLLTNPGSGLLGSPSTPSLTIGPVAEVVAVALAVAAGATTAPAIRGARTSTVGALQDSAHTPRRRAWVNALSARLPVPLLLGLRLAARRPRRSVLTAVSLAIAVAMIVAALTLQHKIDLNRQEHTGLFVGTTTVGDRVSHLVFLLSAVLGVLAAVNAIFTAWATVIDAERSTALARALGATPRQISTGLTAAQLIPGLVAGALGIPLGLGLYQLAGGHLADASPPVLWLVAVIPGTLLVIGLLTAVPARVGAARSPAAILRSD